MFNPKHIIIALYKLFVGTEHKSLNSSYNGAKTADFFRKRS